MPIVVQIEPQMRLLASQYLDRCRARAAACQMTDMREMQKFGHNLKGSGGGYGFDQISEIGRQLEITARAGNLAQARHWHAALVAYLQDVTIAE